MGEVKAMSKAIGRAILILAFVAALVIAAHWSPAVIRTLVAGGPAIHDAVTLPSSIAMCGRDWVIDVQRRQVTIEEIRTTGGFEPVVVDPGLFAPCPPGPCGRVAEAGPCDTVVYVRVGDDAYIAYELQGGP